MQSNVKQLSDYRKLTRVPPYPGNADPKDSDGGGEIVVRVKLVIKDEGLPEEPEPVPEKKGLLWPTAVFGTLAYLLFGT